MFNKLKNWRCIAARYDNTAASSLGFVSIAPAFLWISFVHGRSVILDEIRKRWPWLKHLFADGAYD